MEDDHQRVSSEVKEVVRGVEVCPVSSVDQPLWDGLMQKHHYLAFRGMIGESLRYAAVYRPDGWHCWDGPVQLSNALLWISGLGGRYPLSSNDSLCSRIIANS